jgi:hypothetical protein
VSSPALAAAAVITAATARQALILAAIVRSRRFLTQPAAVVGCRAPGQVPPRFFIVVPVLREAAILEETVAHFR